MVLKLLLQFNEIDCDVGVWFEESLLSSDILIDVWTKVGLALGSGDLLINFLFYFNDNSEIETSQLLSIVKLNDLVHL